MANDDGTLSAKKMRSRAGVRRTTIPMLMHNNRLPGILLSNVRPQAGKLKVRDQRAKLISPYIHLEVVATTRIFKHFHSAAVEYEKKALLPSAEKKTQKFFRWHCFWNYCFECTIGRSLASVFREMSLRIPRTHNVFIKYSTQVKFLSYSFPQHPSCQPPRVWTG